MSEAMLKFRSTRFGDLEVPEGSVIEIIDGLIGFNTSRRYVLLEYNPPFSWLHSVDDPALAFVVVNAAEFGDQYSIRLPVGDKEIDIQESDDVAIVNLVTIRPDPSMTTVNLKAPVVVNLRNRRGRQIILDDARFPTRFALWAAESTDQDKK